jgi:predicted DCC family thiol-disulfide oxidoreductase YuxK
MWVVFIPGPFWDWLFKGFRAKGFHQLTIFFDADCGFCHKSVRILKEFLLLKEVKILPAQENKSILTAMEKNHSWVVVNRKNERFFHYQAFIEILSHSPLGKLFIPFFSSKPIKFLGPKCYHWISHRRALMGKLSQFLTYQVHKKDILTIHWISEFLGVFIFLTILMWNLTTIKKLGIRAPFFQEVTRWLHLYQEWNMFAPYPKMDNIWVEIPATLGDGSELELLSGNRDIFSVKNHSFPDRIPNEHWRKFYLNLSDRHDYARYYGGYLCRAWNDRRLRWIPHTTLRKLEIIVFSQLNLPNGNKGGITRKLSWKHWCFDEDFKRDNPGNNSQ